MTGMLFTSTLMSLQLNRRPFVSRVNFLHKTVTLPIHIAVVVFSSFRQAEAQSLSVSHAHLIAQIVTV